MATPQRDTQGMIYVDRVMLNDLVNLLTGALGHSTLLLKENVAGLASPDLSSIEDIQAACRLAIDLVDNWKARLPPAPDPRD